ncbi:DUF6524 family protein [Myxococcota bacterium]|nr:DUF6524 family protein [Myxococcota bacterium]
MTNDGSRLIRFFRNLRLVLVFVLVHLTYNPEGASYYHWALKPWWDGFFGAGKLVGPHSLKAFVGVLLLGGWFWFLRSTRRKIGGLGILLTIAFFATLGWVLNDYGLFPNVGSWMLQHLLLLIVSIVLSLGVLLPEPKAKVVVAKQEKLPAKQGSETA